MDIRLSNVNTKLLSELLKDSSSIDKKNSRVSMLLFEGGNVRVLTEDSLSSIVKIYDINEGELFTFDIENDIRFVFDNAQSHSKIMKDLYFGKDIMLDVDDETNFVKTMYLVDEENGMVRNIDAHPTNSEFQEYSNDYFESVYSLTDTESIYLTSQKLDIVRKFASDNVDKDTQFEIISDENGELSIKTSVDRLFLGNYKTDLDTGKVEKEYIKALDTNHYNMGIKSFESIKYLLFVSDRGEDANYTVKIKINLATDISSDSVNINSVETSTDWSDMFMQ